MKLLIVFALLEITLGASVDRLPRDLSQNSLSLQPSGLGYLPPDSCVPSTVYRTQTQYSTVVIPSTVYRTDVQYVTQTEFRTQPVYTTIFSEIVRTQVVPEIQYRTVTVTSTRDNVQTRVITLLPPEVKLCGETRQDVRTEVQYSTQFIIKTQQIPTTITRNVVSTHVVPQQVISTVYQHDRTVTRQQQIPGTTRTIESTQYSTVYSTLVLPGSDITQTQYVTITNYQTQTITQPGQTQYITSTQVIPVTTTIFSEQVVTRTQTQFITKTQFEQRVSTVVRTQQVPQYFTRTITVPQPVVSTLYSTQVVPTTIYTQQTVPTVVNLPAQTQYVTVTRTDVRTQQIPGQTRIQYVTSTFYNTIFITSTVYNEQVNTITATTTIPPYCRTGYNYPTPSRGFNPLGR
ncbi:LOW QUALITY PROTEIN: mucin-3A-like [Macrobrachium nipponense]|uniref:LOW QUALITY PROTEIN: mucin-3A-like n=1 Tax=Macrobrachium nipponense TaxID=159736 RepID=UPI0030C84550